MQTITTNGEITGDGLHHHHHKAITWSSVFAGSVSAISVSLILLILGSGLGLSVLSPFSRAGNTATQITVAAIGWLIVMQWVSSALGGYLAGRLRCKHGTLHTDEAFFRDTAHGFLAWAVATIVVAAFSVSALTAGLSGGAHVAGMAAVATAAKTGPEKPVGPGPADSNMYFVDTLFRSSHPTAVNNDTHEVRGETARILVNGIKDGDVSEEDRAYLAQQVAARANITQPEATKRVDDTIAKMKAEEEKLKQAADTARKAGATLSIFTFLSLIIGAFIASVAGALGGKRRDEY